MCGRAAWGLWAGCARACVACVAYCCLRFPETRVCVCVRACVRVPCIGVPSTRRGALQSPCRICAVVIVAVSASASCPSAVGSSSIIRNREPCATSHLSSDTCRTSGGGSAPAPGAGRGAGPSWLSWLSLLVPGWPPRGRAASQHYGSKGGRRGGGRALQHIFPPAAFRVCLRVPYKR